MPRKNNSFPAIVPAAAAVTAATFHSWLSVVRLLVKQEKVLIPIDALLCAIAAGTFLIWFLRSGRQVRLRRGHLLTALLMIACLISCFVACFVWKKNMLYPNRIYILDTFATLMIIYPLGHYIGRKKDQTPLKIWLHVNILIWSVFMAYVLKIILSYKMQALPGGGYITMGKNLVGLRYNCNPNTSGLVQMLVFLLLILLFFVDRTIPAKTACVLLAAMHYLALILTRSRTSIITAVLGAAAMVYLQLSAEARKESSRLIAGTGSRTPRTPAETGTKTSRSTAEAKTQPPRTPWFSEAGQLDTPRPAQEKTTPARRTDTTAPSRRKYIPAATAIALMIVLLAAEPIVMHTFWSVKAKRAGKKRSDAQTTEMTTARATEMTTPADSPTILATLTARPRTPERTDPAASSFLVTAHAARIPALQDKAPQAKASQIATRQGKPLQANTLPDKTLRDRKTPQNTTRKAEETEDTAQTGQQDKTITYYINRLLTGRLEVWSAAVKALLTDPPQRLLTGTSPDRVFQAIYIASGEKHRKYAHNQFLEFAVTTGIPSLIVFILFLVYTIKNIRKLLRISPEDTYARLLTVLFAVLILANMTESTLLFYQFPSAYIFFFICGWFNERRIAEESRARRFQN